MRQRLFICICCMWSCLLHAQKTDFPFQWVEMPLEVKEILKEQYENKNCGAESNVYNIGVRDDVEPQNGIYWYHGMGPHFPHKVFVYYNNGVYVFDGYVEYSHNSILLDYANCVDSLKINKVDSTTYLNAIRSIFSEKNIKCTKKKKLNKKSANRQFLKGEWFVQIAKITNIKEEKWYRTCGLTHALIRTNKQNYTLSFFHREKLEECDDITMHCHFDKFVIDEAYYYNKKIFLLMTRNNKDGTKLSFLISKNENSEF